MNRRKFLKSAGVAAAAGVMHTGLWWMADPAPALAGLPVPDRALKDQLLKRQYFDRHFADDVFLDLSERCIFQSCLARFKRIQQLIGYANFCLVGFDEALVYAKNYARVGRFTRDELDFLEKIFNRKAQGYGFMGKKAVPSMTSRIDRNRVHKIDGTGNFLFKGRPVDMYHRIRQQIGEDVVLTSGIRGVVKQFFLFLNKTDQSRGNLSMASRSLAPPGYSFHGVGDFDVGKKGFGADNFTERFTRTRIYAQLSDLGYITFRYDRDNHLGVRFEPWHVEVTG